MNNKDYITLYSTFAMEQMRRYGIPASVTLAQGICESASGQSELSRNSSWIENGGKYLVYTDDRPNEKFCQYANVGDSYEHHSQFLKRNGRYAELFQLSPDDYKGWTNGLQDAGYASSKQYAATLQNIIEKNGLQKYDQMVMQEMKAEGKSFGTTDNPRQATSDDVSVQDTEEKKYSFPLKRDKFILVTSPFGTRKDPLDASKSQLHKGIDIQTNHEAVLATEDKGKVVNVNSNANTNGGRSVTVEYNRNDGSIYQCTYMHLDSISVKVGDEVAAGQKLGISGNTGYRTTGEHLHFGVKSISTDGTKREIDPAAYLAEIAQKGNISLQVLSNGKDLTAQYKSAGQSDANVQPETAMSPDDWMKKILSSEDSEVNMPIADPVIEIAMTMFTSLMALALQIDKSSEEEKMQKATGAAISKSIDLTPILPSYKTCTISLQDGKPNLYADNGVVQLNRELSNAEITKIQQTLGSTMMNDDEKRRSIASVIKSAVVTLQMSQNYQNNLENQQGRQESVQLK